MDQTRFSILDAVIAERRGGEAAAWDSSRHLSERLIETGHPNLAVFCHFITAFSRRPLTALTLIISITFGIGFWADASVAEVSDTSKIPVVIEEPSAPNPTPLSAD